MGAASTGIAGAPSQLADGKNPKVKVTVVQTEMGNALLVEGISGGLNPAGQPTEAALSFGGGVMLAQADVLKGILIELRVISNILTAGLNTSDTPAALRADENEGLGWNNADGSD